MDHHPLASMTGSRSPEVIASRYRLDGWLGAGGMAEVFVATDLVLGRLVAVKRMPSAAVVDPTARARFAREARALARVNHPNVVTVFDAIEDDGRPFLVMELVDGTTLRDALDRKTGLPPMRTVIIASGIAEGLSAMHAREIVHRDLKPSNVFLTVSGAVKIGDFGIARIASDPALTRTGEMFGSAPYIAPEQVNGGVVDGRADLYSLGCVMFEMLAGRPPFEGDDPLSLTYQHLHTEPTRIDALVPGLPGGLASIVHGLLSKAPEDRPQTADQVGLALAGVPVVVPTVARDVLPADAPDVPAEVAPTTPLGHATTAVLPPRRADTRQGHRRLATWVPWAAFVAISITVLLVLSAMTGGRERGASSNPSASRAPASSQGSPHTSASPASPAPASASATLPPAASPGEAAAVLEDLVRQMESVGAVGGDLAKGLEHGAEDVVRDLEHGDTQRAYDVINGMRDGLASAVELREVSPENAQQLQGAIDQLASTVGPLGSSGNQGGGDEGD